MINSLVFCNRELRYIISESGQVSTVFKVVSNSGCSSSADLHSTCFNCKHCDLEFNHVSSLSRHLKSKHCNEKKLSSGHYCKQCSEASVSFIDYCCYVDVYVIILTECKMRRSLFNTYNSIMKKKWLPILKVLTV